MPPLVTDNRVPSWASGFVCFFFFFLFSLLRHLSRLRCKRKKNLLFPTSMSPSPIDDRMLKPQSPLSLEKHMVISEKVISHQGDVDLAGLSSLEPYVALLSRWRSGRSCCGASQAEPSLSHGPARSLSAHKMNYLNISLLNNIAISNIIQFCWMLFSSGAGIPHSNTPRRTAVQSILYHTVWLQKLCSSLSIRAERLVNHKDSDLTN